MNRFRFPSMLLLCATILITLGCGKSDSDDSGGGSQDTDDSLSLDMGIPASLTGGQSQALQASPAAVVAAVALAAESSGTGQPCAYNGVTDDDPFRNGYQMTKFMVAAIATWTCVADQLITLSDLVDNSGAIIETEHDASDPNYDPKEPTHYSVTGDSITQTTIRLYYGYPRDIPPTVDEDPQFFISWNEAESGELSGRLLIDGLGINPAERQAEDPTMMRMDFDYTDVQKMVDMYLQFDDGNEWADGFRIQLTKDLTANALQQVFLAKGLIEMKRQFIPVASISEIPRFSMVTVSDKFGSGAATAEFGDVAVYMPLGPVFNNESLGDFLFTKTDNYYFQSDGDWDYILKEVTSTEYKGGSTSSDATNAAIQSYFNDLGLLSGSEVTDCLVSSGDDQNCIDLMNAVIDDGFAGQEPNQGTDPGDWRSAALASPMYLDTVYPNGVDWTGAFDWVFTP